MSHPASLERKARLIADANIKARPNADYDFELVVAYRILEALGVTE